jgi:prevent-host-death family protein
MHVPVSEAKAHLTDLVRRAEEGEEIVLTRHNQPVVRLMAIRAPISAAERRRVIATARAAASSANAGPGAARSQDFLYDDDGLPN